MAIQTINIGNQVNDGLGDDLRTAFQKVNANFATLDESLSVTGLNIPETSSGVGIFAQQNGRYLEFKKLVEGTKILLTDNVDSIEIRSTQKDAFTKITTNSGSIEADESLSVASNEIVIRGINDVNVFASGRTISIDTVLDLNQILKNLDFGPITGDFDSTVQFNTANSNIEFGTFTNPGRIGLDLGAA